MLLVNLNTGKDREKDVYKENKRKKKSKKEDPFKHLRFPDSSVGKEPSYNADGIEVGARGQNIKSDKEPWGDQDCSLLWPRTVLPALESCSFAPKN